MASLNTASTLISQRARPPTLAPSIKSHGLEVFGLSRFEPNVPNPSGVPTIAVSGIVESDELVAENAEVKQLQYVTTSFLDARIVFPEAVTGTYVCNENPFVGKIMMIYPNPTNPSKYLHWLIAPPLYIQAIWTNGDSRTVTINSTHPVFGNQVKYMSEQTRIIAQLRAANPSAQLGFNFAVDKIPNTEPYGDPPNGSMSITVVGGDFTPGPGGTYNQNELSVDIYLDSRFEVPLPSV